MEDPVCWAGRWWWNDFFSDFFLDSLNSHKSKREVKSNLSSRRVFLLHFGAVNVRVESFIYKYLNKFVIASSVSQASRTYVSHNFSEISYR